MKRLVDDLVDHERPVIIAGVDVVDPARHRVSQHRDCFGAVTWRPEHLRPGELHRPKAHAVDGEAAELKRGRCHEILRGMGGTWERLDRFISMRLLGSFNDRAGASSTRLAATGVSTP